MIAESSRRRPEFREASWVTLGDGQAWCFPKPILAVSRKGSDLDDLLDRAGERLDFTVGHMRSMVGLASELLCRNYDLSDDECGDLLSFDMNDPANVARWRTINLVILGATPDGDSIPRTFSRWVKVTLLANGINADMEVGDAIDVAYYLLALNTEFSRRAVPPSHYCDASARASAEAELDELI